MSKIHIELLDKERSVIFGNLDAFKNDGYLAGGTALALQLNHRISEDFDVFIEHEIDNKLRLKVKEIFPNVVFYVNSADQISFASESGVKITFLWYYFTHLKTFVPTDSLPLASIDDILADKAHAIGRRAVWRDYVDVFYSLKNNHTDLGQMIKDAHIKFKGEFVATQFLEQLRYFDDIKTVPIELVDKQYSDDEIKSYLTQSVAIYLKSILPKK